jgi:hypothetical protein
MRNFDIKTIHMPVKKTSYMLRSGKDNSELKVSGVYSIHLNVENYT